MCDSIEGLRDDVNEILDDIESSFRLTSEGVKGDA
jgi:hypothetical protein